MAKQKPKPKASLKIAEVEPESTLRMHVNGHELTGEKRSGSWTFACPDFPDLARTYSGDTTMGHMVEAYMLRALAGAIRIRELAEGS